MFVQSDCVLNSVLNLCCPDSHQEAQLVLERLLRDDDEVVLVWYLMGWLHVLIEDRDSAHFYLENASEVWQLLNYVCLCVCVVCVV